MSGQRNRGAGNDDRCADIATHGVKRNSNLLRHERPGNLIFCGLEALGRGLEFATDSGDRRERNAAPRPGRDNSVSPSRHNLLTAPFWMPSRPRRNSAHAKKSSLFKALNPNSGTCPESAFVAMRAATTTLHLSALPPSGLLRMLLRTGRFCVELQRLERGKRMILGVGGRDQRLENRVRLARIGIDRQEQRIGREPAEIDDAIDRSAPADPEFRCRFRRPRRPDRPVPEFARAARRSDRSARRSRSRSDRA